MFIVGLRDSKLSRKKCSKILYPNIYGLINDDEF